MTRAEEPTKVEQAKAKPEDCHMTIGWSQESPILEVLDFTGSFE